MNRKPIVLALAVAAIGAGCAAPERSRNLNDPKVTARTMAEQVCSTCHGESAQGRENFPRLAGQHADYLVKQLGVFQRTDERPEGAVMKVIAHQLTQGNIEAVAAYLQTVPPR